MLMITSPKTDGRKIRLSRKSNEVLLQDRRTYSNLLTQDLKPLSGNPNHSRSTGIILRHDLDSIGRHVESGFVRVPLIGFAV
jgi:hypothetical protein